MRRWIHSLIVALLCLTLFVDTAKACWFLRHHRRTPACRPAPCRPACPTACCLPCEPVDTVCDTVVAEHVPAAAREVVEFTVEEPVATTTPADAPVARQPDAAAVAESVLQHGPTLVVGPQPAATAAPIVVPEAAGLAAREPLPNLKAAEPADPALVAPASNEEPVDEHPAATDSQAKTSAPGDDAEAAGETADPKSSAAEKPMPAEPAPAADLAGGPQPTPTARPPQEPNLFDLFDDEASDDDAAAGEESADDLSDATEEQTDGVEESEDMAEDEGAEEEMAEEEDAQDAAEATGDEATADPAEDDAEAPGEQPDDEPAATESDPFAAVTIPAEPMRRWTDDTGTRHAQGWLVELHADRVRILKTNGRHTTVPLESLSAADRDYVTAVGVRLAAERTGQSTVATATAGL
jgi:hypothetical protein